MMKIPPINLVLLKRYTTTQPSVFDDTVYSVFYHLKQAGFDVHVSCNVVVPEALNIIWGAGMHFSPPLDHIRQVAKPEFSIIFNMEQIGSDSQLVTDDYLRFLSEYRVLDYNQHNVNGLLARYPDTHCQEFPLLPSPTFASDWTADWTLAGPQPAIAFWGARNERRQNMLNLLEGAGHTVQIVPGLYGQHLSSAIAHAQLCLNVHFYQSAIFELARCLRPLAMGMPVVSEQSSLPSLVDWQHSGILFSDYEDMPACCHRLLNDPALAQQSIRQTLHFLHQPKWVDLTRETMLSMLR